MIESFRDLEVWREGIELTVLAYGISRKLPTEERYLLATQLRRAAASIPSNVAEGHSRASTREYARFVAIALGSLAELETHLTVAQRVGYIDPSDLDDIGLAASQLGRKLRRLQMALHNKLAAASRSRAPVPSPQPPVPGPESRVP